MDNAPAPSPAPAPSAPPAGLPGLGALMTAGTGVTLDNAGVLIGVWAVCHAPPQVLGLVVRMTSGLNDKEGIRAAIANHDFSGLAGIGAVALVGVTLGVLAYAATILLATRAFRGRPVALGDLLLDGVGRMWPLFAASAVVGLAIGFGTLLLILPGLYLLFRLCLASVATCAEELDPLDAVSRSWALTDGRFMDILVFIGALFVVGLVAGVALLAAGVVLRIAGAAAGAVGGAVAGLVVDLAQFVVSAWGTACLTKFYLELADRAPRA